MNIIPTSVLENLTVSDAFIFIFVEAVIIAILVGIIGGLAT